MNEVKAQVVQAENDLLSALRAGELMKGVGMHLNSPDYRNIWNGEMKTHGDLRARIASAIEKGLKSIDYRVASRELCVLDDANVMATLIASETTHMRSGEAKTSGRTVISILWRKINGRWWVGYLHASEEPGDIGNPVWKPQ